MADDLESTIEELATEPESVDRDGVRMKMPNLKDVIAADHHLAAKSTAAAGVTGLRLAKIIAPGIL